MVSSGYSIRPARHGEGAVLRGIEWEAQQMFRLAGLDEIARRAVAPATFFDGFIANSQALVATDGTDVPVGFLLWETLDACAYINELDVLPAHAGHRLGAALIDTLAAGARKMGLRALTLTTFLSVPWNAAYYRRLGFGDMVPAEIGPDLAITIERQRASGLNLYQRVAMRRSLEDTSL